MDKGQIVENGTYSDLMAAGGAFSSMQAQYLTNTSSREEDIEEKPAGDNAKVPQDQIEEKESKLKGIMQDEERKTGAVT